jgi:hypothetical protein
MVLFRRLGFSAIYHFLDDVRGKHASEHGDYQP